MATPRTLGTAALEKIGVLFAGEVLSSVDANKVLSTFNDLVDQFAADRLWIFQITRSPWTIVSGTGQYTVGSGGTVNITRPTYIDHVNFQDTSLSPVQEFKLDLLTDDAWSYLTPKSLTATLPSACYYNPTFGASAQGTLELWPVPTSSTLQGVIYYPQAVAEVSTLDTALYLPPGYRQALIHSLAVDLAPDFGRQVSQELKEAAMEAVGVIKRVNYRMSDLSVDRGALPQSRRWGWSILTGP